VDSGSSFTVVNSRAALQAGIKPRANDPKVTGRGLGGDFISMPLTKTTLELKGLNSVVPVDDYKSQFITAATFPELLVGVSDLPGFRDLLQDQGTPAAIIGIDVWSRCRVMFIGRKDYGRTRTLFLKVGASAI
jgi:hypothetical protein